MTDSDWVSRLQPAPPEQLATAMRNAVNEEIDNPSAEDLLAAADHLLDKVMRTDCETRASAIDLLTVDALMTHALQVASKDPKAQEDFPEQALRRITTAWQ